MGSTQHQPKALSYLFLTEMWERYGFYIVQGLLVLYMTQQFGFSDNESYSILGVFTALAYISPVFGGMLADKYIGFKSAIAMGGCFLIAGYFLLALPLGSYVFYLGLATIIVGTGLFKPNISSLLGAQYTSKDPRREAGFTIFYIGINIGAFLAGASSGYIKEAFGWHMSFALASIGLVIGLLIFTFGQQTIVQMQKNVKLSRNLKFRFLGYFLLAIIGLNFLLKMRTLADWLLPISGIVLIVFLIFLTLQQDYEYRRRMIVLNTLVLSSVVFWMLYLQMFFSANLFVDRLVVKDIFGIHLTTTVFYASESIFIILLGPFFASFWHSLGRNEKNPSPIRKFTLGIFFAGFGFLVLGISTLLPNTDGMINPLWVFGSYLFITIGELLLSPIGLSAITMLAPAHLVGMMMGVWFVATGFGGIFAGMLAKISSVPDTVTTNLDKLDIYQNAFFNFAYLAFVISIILFFVHKALNKLLGQAT